MTKVREISWPEEFSDLKRIEESMVCGICYDYMETTVMTPCSHNYCSLCIRKYLHYKSQCPACFHVFYEKDLYTNRVMDVFIQHYVTVREKLISLIENRTVYNSVIDQKQELLSTPPVRPVRSPFPKSPKVQESKTSEPKTPTASTSSASIFSASASSASTSSASASSASTSKCDASSPSTSRSQKVIPSIARIFSTPKRKDNAVTQSLVTSVKSVSCPVCKVDISENHVNVHLDACLKRETGQKAAAAKRVIPKRPPLPKLVLRVMKDAELRKKMKELSLPTHGDRKALETRFTRYSTIYNAECDKVNPRPIPDLIRQCEMEEKQERKMDCFLVSTASTTRLQIEKNAQEDKIEEAQKTYREANKSSFEKLIEEVRKRRKMTEAQEPEQSTSSTSEPLASTSGSVNILENNADNDKTSLDQSTRVVFNDSDSDESCPLQHYVNLNDSSTSNSIAGSPMKRPKISAKNNFKSKGSLAPQKIFHDPYEASTDESADESIANSPIKNKNSNQKEGKLSKESLSERRIPANSSNNTSVANNDRETEARSLCNSIIKDFSFDGLSDDSSNEFVNKPQEIQQTISASKSLNTPGRLALKKKVESACDIKVPEKQINRTVLGDVLNNSNDDFLFDNINDDSSEFIDSSIVGTKKVEQKMKNGPSKISQNVNPAQRENGISSPKKNAPATLSPVRRPVRKRNKPTRYADDQFLKEDVADEETSNLSNEDALTNDSLGSPSPSEGSLKRRRGRPKINSIDQAEVDLQNPPKRPVRRRQANSEHN